MSDFGDSFRSARESRKLTIDEVAQETRISARFLRAIEKEDFSALPGGLFSRGFVRTYAQAIGLDADEAVARFTALAPPAEKIEPSEPEEADEKAPVQTEGIERHIVPIAIGGLVVLIAIFYFFFQDSFTESTAGNPPPAALEETSQPDPAPGAPTNPQPPGPETSDTPADQGPNGDVANPSPIAQGTGEEAEPPDATTNAGDSVTEADSVVDEEPQETVIAPSPATASNLLVEIDAAAATWIRVQSDGAPPVEMTMQPGSARTFSAERVIDMRIGNAAGIEMRINGEAVPNLGGDGQVMSLSITPDNYRSLVDPDQ